MDDLISRQALLAEYDRLHVGEPGRARKMIEDAPSAQPEYTELTPEEAASEIASGSTMSAYYWLDDMIRLKQMGYAICRKKRMRDDLISRQAAIDVVMCKDCIHRPIIDDPGATDGLGLRFPDFRCPCRCDDGYYSWMPNDNWFCGNGEKEEKTNERKSREAGSGEEVASRTAGLSRGIRLAIGISHKVV